MDELVLGPLAAGEAVLTAAEREMGVVVADIGAVSYTHLTLPTSDLV